LPMPHRAQIRKFLAHHRGYHCEECLAEQLHCSIDEIRSSLGEREAMNVATFYRFCQSCLSEKAVYRLRASA
jgi:uncharacterized protein with PIN domain